VEDRTPAQRFGELTAAAVLQLLAPLMCVLLCFSAFASEREQGTLRQALSLGVKKRDLAIGKALGVAAALGLLLAPATAIGVAALTLLSESAFWSTSAWRAALMGCGYLLYLGGFIGLSLAVSALARSARLALITLLALWIANGLIFPRAVSDLSKRLYPTPSSFEFHERIYGEKEHGADGHNPEDKRLAELKTSVLRQYGVTKVEDLPVNFEGIALQEGEEYTNVIFDNHYGRLWDAFERQNRFHQIAGALAPLLAIRSLSMGLAGTDFAQHRHFAEAAEQYRRRLVKMMNDDLTAKSKTGDFSYFGDERVWKQVPEFEYRAPSVGWALSRHWWSMVVLVAWFLFAGAALLCAVDRMRVDLRPVRRLSAQGLLKKRPAPAHFLERS
jgi:ABC-2 type transport system permease protein